MKLTFNPNLPHQAVAVSSVVGLFAGMGPASPETATALGLGAPPLFPSEAGLGNGLRVEESRLLQNLQRIQETNGLPIASEVQSNDFSVEMETGTGKTYVYLRTVFELNRQYGLTKFVIVVPSLAIREGVLQSISSLRTHFQALYEGTPFAAYTYSSDHPGRLRQFGTSNHIQLLVINIQSFLRDADSSSDDTARPGNIIHRETEKLGGRRPIDFIQAAKPVLIIDEPQSVDGTEKAKAAIAKLCPLFTLRYSATHRDLHHLVYRLDPVEAYERRLVKQIEVASVVDNGTTGTAFIKFDELDNRQRMRARVRFNKVGAKGIARASRWTKAGDDLWIISGGNEEYRDGYIVESISTDGDGGYISFSGGRRLRLGEESGGSADAIVAAQLRETIEQHLQKERFLRSRGIKVLSLIFVDRVADYRTYGDAGNAYPGPLAKVFEETLKEYLNRPENADLLPFDIADLHGGYFSRDKQGRFRDTAGASRADEDTYALIMRDKERLLDPKVPLRFIFSHSALREGWDNPNVFQVCTLSDTRSQERKRQQIGRGLRLPVDSDGHRVFDESVNRLTVIANQSYEDFAKALQNEIEEDFGHDFARIRPTTFRSLTWGTDSPISGPIGDAASEEIWRHLVEVGFLDEEGRFLSAFDPRNPSLHLGLPDHLDGLALQILSILRARHISNRIKNARDRKQLTLDKEAFTSERFRKLWSKISPRTRYRLTFDSESLIVRAAASLAGMEPAQPATVRTTVVDVRISMDGVEAGRVLKDRARPVGNHATNRDIVGFLQRRTGVTRRTIAETLRRSGRLKDALVNQKQFLTAAERALVEATNNLALATAEYHVVAGASWSAGRIKTDAAAGVWHYVQHLYAVRSRGKSLFDAVPCDSEVERAFARELDDNSEVEFFVKLPAWYQVETPLGRYNPDWAFVVGTREKLYLVRETKGSLDEAERRWAENLKVRFGKLHFGALGIDYAVAESWQDVVGMLGE